jgi:hypothetical protein
MNAEKLKKLSGSLTIRPGRVPSILGSRPALAGPLLRGHPAAAAPSYLPMLYSLCGKAHRLTAQLAVQAAHDGCEQIDQEMPRALHQEAQREHLHRMLLDWPRWLGQPQPDTAELHKWALNPAVTLAQWLGMPLDEWLAQWQADPRQALTDWTRRSDHWLAALLGSCREDADALRIAVNPLNCAGDPAAMLTIAGQLSSDPGFTRYPELYGTPRETGCWTRQQQDAPERIDSAWLRLGARVAELARLTLDDTPSLSLGALSLGDGKALAWSETARGLLIHHIRLEGDAQAPRIGDYHVIAPTEWNLHPQGGLAMALSSLPVNDPASRQRANVLMAAFDPCITFELEPLPAGPRMQPHA